MCQPRRTARSRCTLPGGILTVIVCPAIVVEAIEIIDRYMQSFHQAMEEGCVLTDSATDFQPWPAQSISRGKADSRQEVQA
jgi:hypothetical protein